MDSLERCTGSTSLATKPADGGQRFTIGVVLVAIQVALLAVSTLGRTLIPSLVAHHPLGLLLFNASNGTLALVAHRIDAWEYFVVGALRIVIVVPCAYLLGRDYTRTTVSRFVKSRRLRSLAEQPGPGARRVTGALLLLTLSTASCLIAGASRVGSRWLIILVGAGTASRLILIYALIAHYQPQVKTVTHFLDDYQVPLTACSVLIAAGAAWLRMRSLRSGEPPSPGDEDGPS